MLRKLTIQLERVGVGRALCGFATARVWMVQTGAQLCMPPPLGCDTFQKPTQPRLISWGVISGWVCRRMVAVHRRLRPQVVPEDDCGLPEGDWVFGSKGDRIGGGATALVVPEAGTTGCTGGWDYGLYRRLGLRVVPEDGTTGCIGGWDYGLYRRMGLRIVPEAETAGCTGVGMQVVPE